MTYFCNQLETGPVKCRDIEKNVATLFSVHHLSLCCKIETLCRDINFNFQIESKINYFTTQKVCCDILFSALLNLGRDIKELCRNINFLFQFDS